MELLTHVDIDRPGFRTGYGNAVLMVGSCFVENIGARMEYYHLPVLTNPCGIVYNPLSVADTLDSLLTGRRFGPDDLLKNGELWVSLSHHGRFSDRSPERCLEKINGELERAGEHLGRTELLVITWGTAWVYRHRASGLTAANCHKFPASDFERFRLTPEEIVAVYRKLLKRLWQLNPRMRILFTVSPIRHWKDGAHGNQLSKAALLLAVDRLLEISPLVSYFPSYEIVMDELRDYRFYAADMVHLTDQAVDYIWERFQELYLSEETRSLMKRIGKLQKQLGHRPFDAESEAFREFSEKSRRELEEVLASLPKAGN